MSEPVLIVGAGPTGLNLALRLARHGRPFRIIDQASGPGTQSRALAVHARTLEFYRQLGLAEAVVAAGTRIEAIRMLEGGAEVARVDLRDLGGDLSAYPFVLDLPQDEHEALLGERLAAEGARIGWGTRLEGLRQDEAGVEARLGGGETARFAYVAGCDGAHGQVRAALGVALTGGTYEGLFYVADVQRVGGMAPEFVLALDKGDFALRLPSRKGENERLIGWMPKTKAASPSFEDVRANAERLLDIKVAAVNWFSTYRVHHRVAERFRVGRAFLLGDAGHLHSPVGGQGMNTGIGDAANLSWKLAQALDGRAPESLLDTYETERIAFARALVATTDRLFQAIADEGLLGATMRRWIMPRLFPLAAGREAARHAVFRLVSQIRIRYRASPLSEGRAGAIAGGDRLPWLAEADNFAPLASLDWQVHLFGDAEPAFAAACAELRLPLHRFAVTAAARRAGFADGAAYLVRPDGHVGLAQPRAEAATLRRYAETRGLVFG